MIEFDEHVSEKRGMELTPLIDVVFLLLIFFLLTSIFVKPSIPLDLPESETARVMDKPEVSVTIKKDGAVLLNDIEIPSLELYAALSDLYSGTSSRNLKLISDKAVQFGRVVEVMDIAKKAGAENISILTEKKRARDEKL
jgi:biopolymer transport protein ExbD